MNLMRFCSVLSLFALDAVQAQTCVPAIIASNPTSAYVIDGGLVKDVRRGIVWDQCAWGQSGPDCTTGTASSHTWEQALVLPNSANMGIYKGYSDWRLPNIKELRSLVEVCRTNPAINDLVFLATPASYFWSASPTVHRPSGSWSVNFLAGNSSDNTRNSSIYVRLVRAGQ